MLAAAGSPPLRRGESTATPAAAASIELFTGGGGLALAMEAAGFRHLLAVESDSRACATLLSNAASDFRAGTTDPAAAAGRWPLVQDDVRAVDFTPWCGLVDVVAAGVPCQPWSLGGAHQGSADSRNLWPELLRCVRQARPRAVIAENVKGLLRPSFRPYYDYLLRELAAPCERPADGEDWRDHDDRLRTALAGRPAHPSERYSVSFRLVNAADYGVPQIRWRVFVVAFRSDLRRDGWAFPAPTHAAVALARSQAAGGYWERHGLGRRGSVQPVPAEAEGDDGLAPWRTVRDAIDGLPAPSRDQRDDWRWPHHQFWPGAREYPGHTPNDLDRPAKTVKAGVHGVPGGETVVRLDDSRIRYLTVREVARVMTFPDDWWLAGPRSEQMRQLGNAVPPALGQVVARSVGRELAPSPAPA